MGKMYRRFYEVDDKAVWASYDGEKIEVLLAHDIVLSRDQLTGNAPEMLAKIHPTVQGYREESRKLLESILEEECGIVLSYKNWNFPVYDEPQEDFLFTDEDATAPDGWQYKFFCDRGGNWLELVRKGPGGDLESLGTGHLDYLNILLENLLVSKGVDFKSFSRYSPKGEETRYHKPTVEDFLSDFDIVR